MDANKPNSGSEWVDPDDAPEWTDEQFERAELRIGDRVIRPAGAAATEAVTLRLPPEVIDAYRMRGPDWEDRMAAALRKAAGL